MQLGFSYVGFIYLLMLIIPNLIWTKHLPKDYEKYVVNENRLLLVLERLGQVLVSCVVLVFADFNIRPWTPWSWWLVLSFILMLLYEVNWVCYFRSEKTMEDFYSSFLGVPVAAATLPVVAFFLLGVYGKNPLLLAAIIVLGVGHIGVHVAHRKESTAAP